MPDCYQIPPEDGTMAAPVLEVSDLSVSLSPDSAPIITQPVTEQVEATAEVLLSTCGL